MDPLGIPGSWVLSTSKNSRAGIFFAELLQKWKRRVVPLYVHTTKKEESCIWHEIEVIPLRIWRTISSFNKRPPIEELAFKKIAHLVTYIQYSFVYQWTQWLRWKIAKAFVYFQRYSSSKNEVLDFLLLLRSLLLRLFTSFQPGLKGWRVVGVGNCFEHLTESVGKFWPMLRISSCPVFAGVRQV